MSTRPSTTATWATTTNYATSNDPSAVGQPTKNDPSSIAAQGWDYATRPDPTHFNHWMNRVGTWIGWVKDNAIGVDGGTYVMDDVIELRAQGITFSTLASCIIASTGGFFVVPGATAQISGTMRWMSGGVLQLDSGMSITGSPAFSGTLWTWGAPQVVESTLTLSGSGQIRHKPFALNNTGAQTVGIANGDRFAVPLLAGTLTITLSNTGASTGTELTFEAHNNIASGFSCVVTTAEATYNMRADTGGTYYSSLTVYFYGGAWHTLHAVKVP